MEEAHIPITPTDQIDVTCNIGLTLFNKSIRNADTFITVVDKALYKVKQQRRNQVVISETFPSVA